MRPGDGHVTIMIHYQLRCAGDHAFDGWFRDSAAFDLQASRGLVECPVCGDTKVNRALMAPRIAKARPVLNAAGKSEVPAAPPDAVKQGVALPDGVRAAFQRLRAEVERNCDYVGPDFAEEARRIHRGESNRQGIYGESTPEQAESLADEGIEVACIPWLPRSDA